MLVIAIVLIVVVGPKDLPKMMRAFGRTTSKIRSMAGEFRKQFDDAMKEAELDEVKNLASEARKLNPASELKKAMSPMERAAKDVKAGLDSAMNPAKPAEAVTGEAAPASPAPATKAAAASAARPLPEAVGAKRAQAAASAAKGATQAPKAAAPKPAATAGAKATAAPAKPAPRAAKPAAAKPTTSVKTTGAAGTKAGKPAGNSSKAEKKS